MILGPRSKSAPTPGQYNIFSSETALSIKFYVKYLWEEETNVYINDPGPMTKIAAMPIYGKTLQKSSSQEPFDQFQQNTKCRVDDDSITMY